jgi:hypothetical protein
VDRGQYRVADSHTQFRVAKTTWTNKTQEERQRYFRRFRNFVPKDKLTATSTDGKMTVIKPIIICIIFLVIIVVLVENLRLLCEDRSKPHQWEDFHHVHARMSCKFYQYTQGIEI